MPEHSLTLKVLIFFARVVPRIVMTTYLNGITIFIALQGHPFDLDIDEFSVLFTSLFFGMTFAA